MKRITLLGLPFDENASFERGAAEGPPLIREALRSPAGNLFTEGGISLGDPGLFAEAGDLMLNSGDWLGKTASAVQKELRKGNALILLGGDHSISLPVLRAYHHFYPKLTILHIDAHADLYDEFDGSRYSHACPFARIMEEGLASRLIQIGLRTLTAHQRQQALRFGVEQIEMRNLKENPLPPIEGPLYLSMDMDALDPAFAPGVSHPEPGGFTTREVISLIHSLTATLVGADVVEFNPRRDIGGTTARAAAKLVREIAGVMLRTVSP